MFEYICECISTLTSPSVSQLLKELQSHTVCTNTRCFTEIADLTGETPRLHPHGTPFALLLLCATLLGLVATRTKLLRDVGKSASQ